MKQVSVRAGFLTLRFSSGSAFSCLLYVAKLERLAQVVPALRNVGPKGHAKSFQWSAQLLDIAVNDLHGSFVASDVVAWSLISGR